MKPIIVPTDFSPAALSAVNYAADMALALDTSLILLHVYQLPVSVSETPTVLIPVEELEENAEQRLASLRKDLLHITSNKLSIDTEARLGDVPEEVEECCKKHDPLMVVMGSTGHSALERTLFGSTTLAVIHAIRYPVLAVPRGTEYGTGINRVGLAWDFSSSDTSFPLDTISNIVGTFRAGLQVVHVESDMARKTPGQPDPALEQALAPLKPSYHHVSAPDLGEGISAYAEKNNLDLVITVPKKHGFFESLFRKGTTRELIQVSHIPVLCVNSLE